MSSFSPLMLPLHISERLAQDPAALRRSCECASVSETCPHPGRPGAYAACASMLYANAVVIPFKSRRGSSRMRR